MFLKKQKITMKPKAPKAAKPPKTISGGLLQLSGRLDPPSLLTHNPPALPRSPWGWVAWQGWQTEERNKGAAFGQHALHGFLLRRFGGSGTEGLFRAGEGCRACAQIGHWQTLVYEPSTPQVLRSRPSQMHNVALSLSKLSSLAPHEVPNLRTHLGFSQGRDSGSLEQAA